MRAERVVGRPGLHVTSSGWLDPEFLGSSANSLDGPLRTGRRLPVNGRLRSCGASQKGRAQYQLLGSAVSF